MSRKHLVMLLFVAMVLSGSGRGLDLQAVEPSPAGILDAWELATNQHGEASSEITAAEPGQYRLSYAVTDRQGHTSQAEYRFGVIGDRYDWSECPFHGLELIVEKRQYRRGETLRLLINSDRPDSTVLLLLRPTSSSSHSMQIYPRPLMLLPRRSRWRNLHPLPATLVAEPG